MTFRRTLFAHLPNFCHPDFFPGCWRNCFPCGSAQVSSFIMHQMGDSRSRIIFCAIILFLGRLNWPVCSTLNASGSCLLQRSSLLQSGWFQGVEQPKFCWRRIRRFGFSRQCPNMCQAANRRWGARARAGCRCSPSQCSTMQGLPLRPSTFPPSQPNPIQTQSVCYSQKSLCAIHYFLLKLTDFAFVEAHQFCWSSPILLKLTNGRHCKSRCSCRPRKAQHARAEQVDVWHSNENFQNSILTISRWS